MENIELTKNFLNSNKILFGFSGILREYCSGKRDFTPVSIEIHPSAKCNHRCSHCSYARRNKKHTSIDRNVMENLITSIIDMNIKAVYFSGGGEPSLYPDLAQYVERLFKNNIEIALLTNGSFLEKTGILDIAYMFNYIAVSVPSVDENTFQDITGTSYLQKILSLPQTIKFAHKEKAPVIGARVVITGKIFREVLTILDVLKDKGFDYVLFKVVRDYEGTGLGITMQEESELKTMISERDPFDDNYTNINNLFSFKSLPVIQKCIINETGLIANVDTDGKVYPNIVEIGHEDFCIGDLNESSLIEIWNSEQHQRVKAASQKKCSAGLCENCRAIAYNHVIQELLNKLPAKVDYFI